MQNRIRNGDVQSVGYVFICLFITECCTEGKLLTQWAKNLSHWMTGFCRWVTDICVTQL